MVAHQAQGQATQSAAAELADLKANPEFTKRYLSGNAEAKARMASLHEIASRPSTTIAGGDLPSNSERTIASLSTFAGLPPEVEQQMRAGTPVSAAEYSRAVSRREQLLADAGWRAKYLNGDRAARQEMALVSVILSSKVTLRK